jgi:hypothetical protein
MGGTGHLASLVSDQHARSLGYLRKAVPFMIIHYLRPSDLRMPSKADQANADDKLLPEEA